MFKAVIFDQDGTLFDNEPLASESYRLVVESYGKTPIPYKNGLMHPIGMRGNRIWDELKQKHGFEEDTEILRKKRRVHHVNLLQGDLFPMPGVLQLLKLLKNKQIKIALATGSSPDISNIVLEKLHIKKYFNVVITGWDTPESKPHPDPFLLASKRLGIPSEDCVVIEDSLPGILAAKAAGMKTIAVPTIHSKNDDFSVADRVVLSLEKIDWTLLQSL